MDEVFKALNDPSRRLLLDALYVEDGQTLSALCRLLPEMTRFGVMNHLKVLEGAGLVVGRKVGRTKHHYLNPVPIRLVHNRWISKYQEPWAGALSGLKSRLERGRAMAKPTHIYQTYIDATLQVVWDAITDGDQTVQYYYGTRVESDWEAGSSIRYLSPDGAIVADGEIRIVDPPRRLEMTFHARWDPQLEKEGPVIMAWIVEESEGLTRLTVEYTDLDPTTKTYRDFTGGIPYIVAGLKTLLETGRALQPT